MIHPKPALRPNPPTLKLLNSQTLLNFQTFKLFKHGTRNTEHGTRNTEPVFKSRIPSDLLLKPCSQTLHVLPEAMPPGCRTALNNAR
jgi:hypothetical protein